jgi:uncharacterized protein (DUF1015 family)
MEFLMSHVVPFRAVRPQKRFVEEVASCPYDVVSTREAREMAKGNPRSFLHVVRSEIDLPPGVDVYDDQVYEMAKKNLDRLLSENILFQDSRSCFYIYRQKAGKHEQYGIVAGVSVDEYVSGRIKKHELTLAVKECDRVRHITAVNAHTGPVLLFYRDRDSIDRIVREIVRGRPEYDFTADDGVSHTVWVVDDKQHIMALREEFLDVDSLYIADGHHRAASAAAVAGMRKAEDQDHRGDEEYNHILAVLFPHNQLRIMGYNRVIEDLNGLSEREFMYKVGERFLIFSNLGDKLPSQLHEFGMYLDGRWHKLTPKDNIYDRNDVAGALDVTLLQNNLLGPVLGINDPGRDGRIEFVGGSAGMGRLEELVDSGEFAVAFSLYPPTLTQMMSIADAGGVMPPKSTWFEPKPRSGIFVHLL